MQNTVGIKKLPLDPDGKVIADGTANKTFWAVIQTVAGDEQKTTTGWDAVTVPTGVELKGCAIKVREFVDATAMTTENIPFLFSSNSDGSESVYVSNAVIPCVAAIAGDILGYIWTGTAGRVISVISVA